MFDDVGVCPVGNWKISWLLRLFLDMPEWMKAGWYEIEGSWWATIGASCQGIKQGHRSTNLTRSTEMRNSEGGKGKQTTMTNDDGIW